MEICIRCLVTHGVTSVGMQESPLKEVQRVLIKYRKQVGTAFLLLLISNLLAVSNPLLLRLALENKLGDVYAAASLLFAIAFISFILKFLMRVRLLLISRSAEKDAREALFSRLVFQSASFFSKHRIGDLVSRLTSDITMWREVLGPGLMYPPFALTLIIPCIFALAYISPYITIISVLPLFAIPILNRITKKTLYKTSLSVQKTLGTMTSFAEEVFLSIRFIKAYTIEDFTAHKYAKLSQHLKKKSLIFALYQGFLLPIFPLLTRIVTAFVVALFGGLIILFQNELHPADFISFMWIQSYLFLPVLMLGWVLPIYQKGSAAYSRLQEIWQEPFTMPKKKERLFINPPEIRFEDVHYHYPNKKRDVLKGVSFVVPRGAFVGVTGEVGSGKTTLLRLLLGELGHDYRGNIFFDDKELRSFPSGVLQKNITTVEQLPFLFSRSIRENLLFGSEKASDEEMKAAAELASFHESVLNFPDQYGTVVGERGLMLSGGEKQRLAMARAFLESSELLLLDDIFSSLDVESEKIVLDRMKAMFHGKTVLIITHRPRVLKAMDRVIVLSHGKVES